MTDLPTPDAVREYEETVSAGNTWAGCWTDGANVELVPRPLADAAIAALKKQVEEERTARLELEAMLTFWRESEQAEPDDDLLLAHSAYLAGGRPIIHKTWDDLAALTKQVDELRADLARLKSAAAGRGMVSEMADMAEVAVLVCGLHDELARLRHRLHEAYVKPGSTPTKHRP